MLRRLDVGEILDILELYEGGASQRDLAERFDVHRTTVLYVLRRAGVVTRRKVRLLTGEIVDEAAALYRSGLSLRKVGSRFGVSASTVQRELVRAGLELRPRGRT